jgi:uncharacterized protein YndB with AHSA1/START domain
MFLMKNEFTAAVDIHVSASPARVWDALVNPAMIKQYLHGTEAVSEWKAGSPLTFKGTWKGESYLDKGRIIDIQKEKLLRYSWLSSFSGLDDKKENYSVITYELKEEEDGGTRLHLTQDNIATEAGRQGSENNWTTVLNDLKNLLEQ